MARWWLDWQAYSLAAHEPPVGQVVKSAEASI